MKNLVSFYYKFLRTHYARGACYHFGAGISSVSKMQYTTHRVYNKRDLFKTLTSMNIASDHHNHIIHQYGVLGFCGLALTGQALLMSPKGQNTSRDGLVKLWEGAFIICNTITL